MYKTYKAGAYPSAAVYYFPFMWADNLQYWDLCFKTFYGLQLILQWSKLVGLSLSVTSALAFYLRVEPIWDSTLGVNSLTLPQIYDNIFRIDYQYLLLRNILYPHF